MKNDRLLVLGDEGAGRTLVFDFEMCWFEVAYFFVVAAKNESAEFASLRFAVIKCLKFSCADAG